MKKQKLDTIKTSGFKTPKGYFSKVEEHILNEVTLTDKVDASGFEVPESYFDAVEHTIMDRVLNEKETKVVSLFPWKKIIYVSGIAAALVLMFNVFFTSSNPSFSSLEIASIEAYIEIEDYSTYELVSFLNETEFTKDSFIETEIPEGNIEDYLLDNVDFEDLIIE